jgi:hypothetical protein
MELNISSKIYSKKYIIINDNNIEDIIVNILNNCKCYLYIVFKNEKNVDTGINLNLQENSQAKVFVINMMGEKVNNNLKIENNLQENANLDFTIIDIGAKNSNTNYLTVLQGDNSQNRLDAIYLGKENQVKEIDYAGELYGKNTNMNIYVEGALKDKSKKHFKGVIDFKRGSKKAVGNEEEYCTLLSDKAKSLSIPQLLCEEEDVVGNHATAAGKIDKKQLFYLLSRGFDPKQAEKLLVRAKFNRILDKLKDGNCYEKINIMIDDILG